VTAALEAFKSANPHIKVNYVNTGLMFQHYEKLRNALKAGSGIPDAAECEFPIIPGFVLAKAFANLNELGATALKSDYLDWAWSEASQNGVLYSLPWGAGPMILLYRQDIFDKFGLSVPATWDDFAQQARKLKAKTSDVSMTGMAINAGAWWNGLFWQNGSRPFRVDGSSVRITINDKAAKDVVTYWQSLLDEKLVAPQPIFTQDWFNALDAGKFATFPTAAWLLRRLGANAKQGMGHWRVAILPNWKAGKVVGANWGGSSIAVMQASQKKKAAFEFIKWMLHNEQASRIHLENGLFPVLKQTLNNEKLMSEPVHGEFVILAKMERRGQSCELSCALCYRPGR
jgi:multiple sugar transport system substrate-binding protein